METENKVTINLVYMGRRKSIDGKATPAFRLVNKHGEITENGALLYEKFSRMHFGIGSVISVDATDEEGSSTYPNSYSIKTEDRIKDGPLLAGWMAEDADNRTNPAAQAGRQ